MFTIGTYGTVCTQFPGFYPCNGVYFVDCVGFGDSNPNNGYPNQTLLTHLTKKARSIQIVLLVDGSSLRDAEDQHHKADKNFLKDITNILRLVSAKGADNLDKFLIPLLVQPLQPPQRNMD